MNCGDTSSADIIAWLTHPNIAGWWDCLAVYYHSGVSLSTLIRQGLDDLRSGRNVDLYVLFLVSVAVTVGALFGFLESDAV